MYTPSRRTFLQQTLGAAAALNAGKAFPLSAVSEVSGAGNSDGKKIYEVGAVYHYFPWTPQEQLTQDLETIATTGINTINPIPSFELKFGNPEPDFSKMDLILKNCHRLNLRVMPTVFWTGLLASWAASKWPDQFPPVLDVDQREQKLSFADPKVLDLIDHYSRITVERFRNHPSVIAYNIWDEPHMLGFTLQVGQGGAAKADDNPPFDRWFEKWGLKKYGSAAAWFSQWNDVLLNPEYQNFDRPLFYWYATGHILRRINTLVKSLDPVHPTRTHNVGSTTVCQNVNIYTQDDWTMSKVVDQYGLSYYPDIPARNVEDNPEMLAKKKALWDTPWTTSLELTSAHDAAGGKPFVMPEVQTGPQTGFTRYGAEPGMIYDYSRIHMLAWQMAAHDAKGMYFWKWRPHLDDWQAFGRGLAAPDGSITDRAKAAGDAARVLNADPELFLESKPVQPEIAVVYDVYTELKVSSQGRDWGSFPARNMIGIYRELWGDQVRVNVLDARELTADSLKPYKLTIFPFYLCLRKNVSDAIEAYVNSGGTVLADARFGIINPLDRGYEVNPGLGMAKLFGARRDGLVAGYAPWNIRVTDAKGALKGATLPDRVTGRVFREDLQLEKGSEGTVAAVFEETKTPAIVVKRTGSGQSMLLGFSLGISLMEDKGQDLDSGAAALLKAVWQSAGVTPPIQISSLSSARNEGSVERERSAQNTAPVEAVVHSRGRENERLVYLLNWGHQRTEVRTELPWPGSGNVQGKDLVSGSSVQVERKGDGAAFTVSLDGDHAAAVHLQG
jgi:beta-galactosidase GanA